MARKQQTGYFPHDTNARNSSKLIRLRMKHGAEGYGVYFMILERLRDEDGYSSPTDYDMIAFDLHVDTELVRTVVEDFGLFRKSEDGTRFYSSGFLHRMEVKDAERGQRSEAARKAIQARWHRNAEPDTDVYAPDTKKRKENKRKGNNNNSRRCARACCCCCCCRCCKSLSRGRGYGVRAVRLSPHGRAAAARRGRPQGRPPMGRGGADALPADGRGPVWLARQLCDRLPGQR